MASTSNCFDPLVWVIKKGTSPPSATAQGELTSLGKEGGAPGMQTPTYFTCRCDCRLDRRAKGNADMLRSWEGGVSVIRPLTPDFNQL